MSLTTTTVTVMRLNTNHHAKNHNEKNDPEEDV